MIRISPVGLATTPVVNQLPILVTIKEKLCRPFCIDSSIQPSANVVYTSGTPILNGTTVFVPITARITIVTGNRCNTKTQLYTEQFYVAFQGQTDIPTSVTITSLGTIQSGSCVNCGNAHEYSINDSLTITITT